MATTVERIGIVETKVENLSEKLDDLKSDVKQMHDCLDKTRDDLKAKLDEMYDASCTQHAELAKKISGLEKIRERTMWMVAGGVAVLGIFSGHSKEILAFFQ
jgi:predicted nuclease with TOPRIM domain